ncbi:MAG: hypothetical protein KJ592_01820 [Nanoarchaeota archaeon]|nr:hypothetical protein [Nanoarchaeota archaeon]
MAHPFVVPSWFFGYSIMFTLAFAIITLGLGLFAFKIHKLSEQKSTKLFGISFIFISLHYFIQSLLNFSIVSTLNQNICNIMKIDNINSLNTLGAYSHMLFFIMGLATLTYMTLKIENKTTYILLLILPIASIIFSQNKLYLFYAIASIFLIFIAIHYLKNYLKNRQFKTLLILIAFIFLLFGNLHFIFSVNHGVYYIIGHFLELVAYLLILLNFILVLKK